MTIALVFDLDGTLVDSADAIGGVGSALMAELGLPPLDLAEARGYIGHGAAAFLHQALAARAADTERDFPARLARFETLYAAAPGEASVPYPGADAALRALAAAGHPLALCTNKPRAPTLAVLDAHGWTGLFAELVTGDSLPERKPHPAPLLHAARALGGDVVFYIGDSEVDAEAADRAALPFLLYTPGYRKTPVDQLPHAATFDSHDDLPDLVARLASARAAAA